MTRLHLLLAALVVAACAGCATPPPPAPPQGLADLMEQAAERALIEGVRAYDDGHYGQAEQSLRRALDEGLKSPRDRANAHKLLAFITCTSQRVERCKDEFAQARAADASFALSRSEAGHPVWGPVYRSVTP